MARFGRQRAGITNDTAANGTQHREKNQASTVYDEGFYSRRPTLWQWIKITWLDILTMVCMGLIGFGIYRAHLAANRSFPITFRDGRIVYPEAL